MTPDLEIRVITESEDHLSYVLRYAEGKGKKFDRRIEGPTLRAQPRQYQLKVLKRLELLGDQLGLHDEKLGLAEVEKELAAIGHDLYKELFPRELRSEYRQFRKKVRSLLIVSDEPWIPWEIVKPYATEEGDRFDDDFLCCEFELTRWLAKGGSLLTEVAATRVVAVDASDALPSRKLRHTGEEVGCLQRIAERHEGVAFEVLRGATYPETMELLEKGANGVLLFVGHGEFDADDPEESRLLLRDGRALRPRDLHGLVETTLQQDRPLVFFNSCQVAQQDFSLTRIGGWAARWVRECGCGAFVGPQWSVDDALASLFSQSFFAALDGGATFGQAGSLARLRVREAAPGQPSWLAYTIYAHPNGRLRLGSQPQDHLEELGLPRQPESTTDRHSLVPSRTRRWSSRRVASRKSGLVAIALLILLAAGMQWRSCDSKKAEPPPISPPADSATPPNADSVPHAPIIDITALQKPPYSPRDVNFYVQWPAEVDSSIWVSRFENTVKAELAKIHLIFSATSNSAWLVLVDLSLPEFKEGGCRVTAKFSIYHEQRRWSAPESVARRASGFTEDAACDNAVHKVAEYMGRQLTTAYLDKTSEE